MLDAQDILRLTTPKAELATTSKHQSHRITSVFGLASVKPPEFCLPASNDHPIRQLHLSTHEFYLCGPQRNVEPAVLATARKSYFFLRKNHIRSALLHP